MKKNAQRVLVCNDTKFFELFHEFLCHTLEELGCETTVAQSWDNFLNEIQARHSDFSLALVDPSIPGFDLEKLNHVLVKEVGGTLPSIGIRQHPGTSIQNVVNQIKMAGTICKTYPPQDMAFVFNRLLFPEDHDKRAHPRALAALNVEYQVSNHDGWFFEDTFNISTGGCFLRSYRENEAGAEIRMKVYLPDEGDSVDCRGKVVHMRPHNHSETSIFPSGMGIQFTAIEEKDLRRLKGVIQKRLLPIDLEKDS